MEGNKNGEEGTSGATVIPTREERLEMFMSTFTNRKELEDDDNEDETESDGSHPLAFRDFASFELDLYESDGFDVQDYTLVNDAGMIRLFYDSQTGRGQKFLPEITSCAGDAIRQYNTEKGNHFKVVRVVKANVEPVCPYRYYITFDARDETQDIVESFQAIVDVRIPTTKRDVTMVRITQPPHLFSLEAIKANDSTLPVPTHCCSC